MQISASISEALEELGLSGQEIAVYLACLQVGAQPAGTIAKRAKVKRGTTYNCLHELIGKGLIQEFIKHGIRYYTANAAAHLIAITEHKERDIKNLREKLSRLLPELERLRNPLLAPPKVRFFPGIEGVKAIFEDTLRVPGQPVYAVADADYKLGRESKELADFISHYIERRIAKKSWYYGISNRSEKGDRVMRSSKHALRTVKMIKALPLPVEFLIYGSKIAVLCLHNQMFGLIIEDELIAGTARRLHQAVFEQLPLYASTDKRKDKEREPVPGNKRSPKKGGRKSNPGTQR